MNYEFRTHHSEFIIAFGRLVNSDVRRDLLTQTRLKLLLPILATFFVGLTVHAQEVVSPEDRALLERLSRDYTFTIIDRGGGWLYEINNPKWALYRVFTGNAPGTVKVLKRQRTGWEGQWTMTWFTVSSGKATIVEAYFGDESGSDELQYVRQYQPDKIILGHFDKNWKCVPTLQFGNSKTAELCLGYNVPSEPTMKVF